MYIATPHYADILVYSHRSPKRLRYSYIQKQCTHARWWPVQTHTILVNYWISQERDPLIEDNRKINLTVFSVWRGRLLSHCQSKFLSPTHTPVRVCVSISWLLLCSHPPSHIHVCVVALLTVWWRHRWKHCLAEIPESVWHPHTDTFVQLYLWGHSLT